MVTLVGISGSLRKGSYNTALLRAAVSLMPDGATLDAQTIHGIPLYDGDLEAQSGIPAAVSTLKEKVAAADGLIIVTPEYNNSLPGPLKNAIDWMTRPSADIARIFGDRPVAVLGASPGKFGTILSQDAWLPVLRTLKARAWFGGRLMVPHAGAAFDASGALIDDKIRDRLAEFLAGFVAFIEETKPGA